MRFLRCKFFATGGLGMQWIYIDDINDELLVELFQPQRTFASFSHRWCNFVAPRTSLEDEVCVLKTCTAASAGHYEVHGTEAQQLSGQLRPQQQLPESLMFLESYFLYASNFRDEKRHLL